jgi:transcriptional regulator with XRE-family HTH domain
MRAMAKPTRIGPKLPVRAYIAQWRESKGLTQEQLADRLDVSKSTISKWESEDRAPSINTLAAVAEALGVRTEALYRYPGEKTPEDLLAGASETVRQEATKYIEFLIRQNTK